MNTQIITIRGEIGYFRSVCLYNRVCYLYYNGTDYRDYESWRNEYNIYFGTVGEAACVTATRKR
jgi:hypothetical protein